MATLPLQRVLSADGRAAGIATWFGVPWFLWVSFASVACAVLGLHFDISWHRSIGRDAFLNPAHLVLYSSGILSAVFCLYLMLATTFGRNPDLRHHSVRIWGMRAPFGVFVAGWGGLGVLYDALFDNWWHNAYGLDVRFTSPPHLLFSLSLWFEMLGGMLLALSYLNRAETEPGGDWLNRRLLRAIVLVMGALMATAQLFACFSYTFDTRLHNTRAYIAVGIFLPISLALMRRATSFRWTATVMTAIYSVLIEALILVLPLFPATPRLGPIYVPVTHFIPPRFPLLVIVPALALDLLWQRRRQISGPVEALAGGGLFTALFVAVQWPFANFLLSDASANRFFGTRYLGFDDLTAPPDASTWHFQMPQSGAHLLVGMAAAAVCASVGLYVGAALGERLRLVRR